MFGLISCEQRRSGAHHPAVPTPVMTHVVNGRVSPERLQASPLRNRSARSLLTSACDSSRTPYFEVLDQNRWASTCFAETLRLYFTAIATRKERDYWAPK